MNVILVSNRLAKTYSFVLGTKQLAALLLALISLIAACIYTGLQLSTPATVSFTPNASYINNSLDAMAARIGTMQAEIQRLEALGSRLAKLNGIKSDEFNFEQPIAQGGPLKTLPTHSAQGLEQQLNELSMLLNDRSDKLLALEILLLQKQGSAPKHSSPVDSNWFSSNFGRRIDPITGENAMHEGVDYTLDAGSPIYASAGGVVISAETHPQYGKMIEIDHGNDIVTRYAHASRLLVNVGQVVKRGDKIAEVGSTGRSTGNHLHFEVRYKGAAQDPARFLRKQAG